MSTVWRANWQAVDCGNGDRSVGCSLRGSSPPAVSVRPAAEEGDAMPTEPAFTVKYWGITGSFCAPLLPEQVTAKIVDSIEYLARQGRLSSLGPVPGLREAIEREV